MKKILLLLIIAIGFYAISCEKDDEKTTAEVRFTCTSDHPYKLWIDNEYRTTLQGHTFKEYELEEGNHTYYYEQESGYILWATTGSGDFKLVRGESIEFTLP